MIGDQRLLPAAVVAFSEAYVISDSASASGR